MLIGEFLQVLSKNRFKATVHRVKSIINANNRISCPYIIRGMNNIIININDNKYTHSNNSKNNDIIPDFNGLTMKTIHKLLDLKRQKCFRDNDNNEGKQWVLSAFPIDNIPLN